jgi:hypothetical protein
MELKKKIECIHCGSIVEENGTCSCGKVKVADNIVVEGKQGIDYKDKSAKLLNEVV